MTIVSVLQQCTWRVTVFAMSHIGTQTCAILSRNISWEKGCRVRVLVFCVLAIEKKKHNHIRFVSVGRNFAFVAVIVKS